MNHTSDAAMIGCVSVVIHEIEQSDGEMRGHEVELEKAFFPNEMKSSHAAE
jgi:hypothetical protein